jgi:uncharacterized protein (TIGR00297 family)
MTYHQGLILRKFIHLSLGLIIWILSYVVARNALLYLIIAGTAFSLLTYNYKSFHLLHKSAGRSLGTVFYPIGILSSYLILYDLPLFYFQATLLVLSISDTLAGFAGQVNKGNIWIRTLHDKKSFYGIAAYSLSAFLIFYLVLPDSLSLNFPFILFALLWAVILEIASMRGSDNFSIPTGLAIFFLLSYHFEIDYMHQTTIMLALAPGCFLLFKFNILTRRGSFIAFLLGFYLACIKGWPWLMPVLLFFLSSAAFTKLHHAIRGSGKKTSGRNAWQVTANIVWAVLSSALFLITQNEIFILFFIAFVAAVTADTWASEIGPIFNKECFSLSKMKWVPAGTNGGISFVGSLAALAGATTISSISYYGFTGFWHWDVITMLSISAFMACFVDSLLGAFVEEKMLKMNYFKKPKTRETITPNDLINMAGSFTAFMFYLFISWIF